ncbi:hypothetical protein C8R47DRAFT_1241564 [Mycena vitilis]|nr:hypothetical protein C8R47DRAFT_1241564 [Mycena vitilis]
MASDKPLDQSVVTGNDRLISTIERCFSELTKKQEDQSNRFHETLQTLKPKLPTTDTKTAFWNAYKTLADEHDKELQQKYSTDLDTALIFAGLFSAVDSAFIIQIQPAIQPRGTPLVVLVAQNLLYVSLFSTLLAALLAVLGKQWLMHYTAAGERGTIEARGLERQRKLDGLRKWKFDSVMQILDYSSSPLRSRSIWEIHLSLAIVVLFFTSIGSITYAALLMSAAAFPDSPFQTPLAPLVARLIPRTLWVKSERFLAQVMVWPRIIIRRAFFEARRLRSQTDNPFPFFKHSAPLEMISEGPSLDAVFKGPFPAPSPEVPAVAWVLEMSTDPRTVAVAAEMVIKLQWPPRMNVRPQLPKLKDGILSSFHYRCVDAGEERDWDDSTTNGVAGLLAALLYHGVPAETRHIDIILRALVSPGRVSKHAAVLLVQDSQWAWFQNEQLHPTFRGTSLWSCLMRIAIEDRTPGAYYHFAHCCVRMGSKLVHMTPWQPHIRSEMCSWILNLFQTAWKRPSLYEAYSSVIAKLGQCQIEYEFDDPPERAMGLTSQVLRHTWGDFELTTPEHMRTFLVPWLRCTGLVVFHRFGLERGPPRTSFQTTFIIPLQDALLRAAALVRDWLAKGDSEQGEIPGEWAEVLDTTATLLEQLAKWTTKGAEPDGARADGDLMWSWGMIQYAIDTLETALKTMSIPLQMQRSD